jgi:DMSO/TMAO reductase YedYZ heme-binding membrane subunit
MRGWRIVGVATGLLLFAFAVVVAIFGTDEHGLRVLVRSTARISFLVFLPVYLASPLRRLWKSEATRWLLANRRQLGVSFAIAHLLHGGAIYMLSLLMGDAFEASPVTLIFGGFAYVLVFAMAITSSDRMVARLGRSRWRALHRFGLHYIWTIWLLQWGRLSFESLFYLPFTLLTVAALGVRIAARRHPRTASSGPATAAVSS